MKVLFVGDIHGRNDWEYMVKNSLLKFHKIVFLGDYVDSFDVNPVIILDNLKNIIEYKEKYPKEITLLLGNHDFAYIDQHCGTSGYNWRCAYDYRQLFLQKHNLFQVAWGYKNSDTNRYTLATHAGLTTTYYNNYIKPKLDNPESALNKFLDGIKTKHLHKILNYMRNDQDLWKVGAMRGGMGTPGPLWADYDELIKDNYKGINQVFGHTAENTICINNIDGDLLVKVDGNLKGSTASIILDL